MKIKSRIEKIKLQDMKLTFYGYVYSENIVDIIKSEIVIKNKKKNNEIVYELEEELRTDLEFLHNELEGIEGKAKGFKAIDINLDELYQLEGTWEFFFKITLKDKVIYENIEIPLIELKNLISESIIDFEGEKIWRKPIFKESRFLSIEISKVKGKELIKARKNILKKKLRIIKKFLKEKKYFELEILISFIMLEKILRRKKIYFLGERKDTAQDNTYHLFNYMVNNKYKNVFYVIDKSSPDYKKLSNYKNILSFGSLKHNLYLLSSNITISSYVENNNIYTEEYKYILKYFPEFRQNKKVFLQHGVIAVSRVNHSLHKNKVDYDMFIVSSDFEKKHIVKEYGYSKEEVIVSGLARWDKLNNDDVKKKILLMPTWRKWIKSEDDLLNSKYFHKYISLLNNQKLKKYLIDNDVEITFYPHYQVQKVLNDIKIDNPKVKIIKKEQCSVQELINSHYMLITDYSTVSFDFAYLLKPVLFYQFDYNDFYGKHYNVGPIDHKKDLFGPVINEEEVLIDNIIKYFNKEKMDFKFSEKSNKYIKYRDKNNSFRIMENIEKLQYK